MPLLRPGNIAGIERLAKRDDIARHITFDTVEYNAVDSSVFEPPAAIKALIK